ncbi:MAG: hypothetical protein BalsKO_05590 [Balneolaceae bacterium]
MRYFYLGLIVLLGSCAKPGMMYQFASTNYDDINPKYLTNAHSTVRESNIELVIHDPSLATYIEQVAITIHNEEHSDLSIIGVDYDNLSKVNYLNVRLIDKNGSVLKTFSMNDAYDYSQYDGFSFLTDNRIKLIDASSNRYPYTIEYEYSKTLYGTLNLPNWYPSLPDQSVELSSFSIIDFNTGVRTHPVNFEQGLDGGELTNKPGKTWFYNNKSAIAVEPYSPVLENIPYMLVSPGKFEIGGSKGDATSWNSFGKWYYELGAETRDLPSTTKAEIDALIKDVQNEEEIVSILFNYLQEKNRYVSIQLGIGGWKPFPASFVHENSYGDCKALTNFMLAALEYVGIEAHAVLIDASSGIPLIEEFPGNQFNHVVLRVTLENREEIWLECTSKYLPPNNLGDGFSKKALLVSEQGGKIVETPNSTYSENGKVSVYTIKINEDGSADLNVNWTYSGASIASVVYQILPVSISERNKWLESMLSVDENSVKQADFSKVNSTRQSSEIDFVVNIEKYANASNKRLFIPLNKLNKWDLKLENSNNRSLPVRFNYAFTEIDTLHFDVPEGYEIETLPRLGSAEYDFATVEQEVSQIGESRFLYTRSLSLKDREIKAEHYLELEEFFNELRRLDNQQLVLVRKEGT